MWLSLENECGCEELTCKDVYKLKKSQKWWYMFTAEIKKS